MRLAPLALLLLGCTTTNNTYELLHEEGGGGDGGSLESAAGDAPQGAQDSAAADASSSIDSSSPAADTGAQVDSSAPLEASVDAAPVDAGADVPSVPVYDQCLLATGTVSCVAGNEFMVYPSTGMGSMVFCGTVTPHHCPSGWICSQPWVNPNESAACQ